MVKKFDAIYENGVLRPLSPLSLADGEKVQLSLEEPIDPALVQICEAAKAADPLYPGPILAYEAAAQLQEFIEQSKEKGE